MTKSKITYAKAGGPPKNWNKLVIRDAEGNEVTNVLEVDTEKGELRRHASNPDGTTKTKGGSIVTEELKGEFTIEVRE